MIEAYEAVLGSMILDNDCIVEVAEKVTSDMFPDMNLRNIWNAIISLNDRNMVADDVTIKAEMGDNWDRDAFVSTMESVCHASSANHYAGIVLEAHRKVEVTSLAGDVTRITSGDGTASEWITEINEACKQRLEFDEDIDEQIGDVAKELTFDPKDSNMLPTGFNAIDDTIIGMKTTDYVVIAGRPGMGKTSLMVDIATDLGGVRGIPVSFYSCEMSPSQIAKRMCSAISRVPLFRVESPNSIPLDTDRPNLLAAAKQLEHCKMYIKSAGGITPSKLKRMVSNDIRKYGIKVAFVDHLHLMRADKPTGNGYQDLTSISRSIKQIALEVGVPIVMGCQLSRTEEAKEPKLQDVRGTGAIEEDADLVIAIHRPCYWTGIKDNEAFFYILKGRHFGEGVGEAEFHGELTSFSDKC